MGLSGKIRAGKTSIKDIQLHPTQDYLAIVGLDRFLRFSINKDYIIHKQKI
ncbi:MAG: hypothetical protein ACK52J_00655 [bacterium]